MARKATSSKKSVKRKTAGTSPGADQKQQKKTTKKTAAVKQKQQKKTDKPSAAAKKSPPHHLVGAWTTSRMILHAALEMTNKGAVNAMLLYVDGLADLNELDMLDFTADMQIVLVARLEENYQAALKHTKKVVRLPSVNLTRMGQIKMAVMLSFSKRFLLPGDRFVFLTGLTTGQIDTLMTLEVGQEYEMFQTVDQPPLTEHIRRAVFERVLTLALELAAEGREGKSVGAIFVLGDTTTVLEHSRQMIMNPFKGYPENERNILNNHMRETVKEFSAIDGAFIIKGTGAIVSAGTYLLPKVVGEDLPQGLGARHVAAAAITVVTRSIAITISESTGTVRIWRQGQLITEIEKATRAHHPFSAPSMDSE